MIVFPAGFATSAEVDLDNSRIGYQSYTRDSTSTASASSETDEGPSDAPLRPDTAEYWLPSTTPATWTLDIGSSKAIDYVGIANHELGTKNYSVRVDVSDDNATWEQFSSDLIPADDSPIMFLDTQVTRRYCRLTFTCLSSPDDPARVAVINVGVALAMQRRIYGGHKPLSLSRSTVLTQNLSKGGQFLGQGFVRNGVSGSALYKHLTPSWYRSQFDPFVESARRYPYFYAWRPSSYPLEVAYVWTGQDIAPSNMGVLDFMQVSWNMNGIGNG